MKKNELVSIIIPCYNHAQYLEESVQSAIDQTYSNIEIIIVNDGSSDNTQEVAEGLQRAYPEKIKVISQKNSGVSEARNNAIRQSKGQYILPLDADDLIGKSMISSCLKSMIENDADIVYVDTQCFGIKKNLIRKLPFSENNFLYLCLCNVTSLYKKGIWKKLGGYAKNMKEGYEDWEFWIHALKKGYKFQLLSEPLLLYRTQEISRNTKAEVKDSYLKAIITLNHPELYTTEWVQKAINSIKKTEASADLYLYSPKDLSINEKHLTNTISQYLAANKLEEKQLIDIPDSDKKIGFFALDMVEKRKHLKQIYKETKADFILFYAPLRYEVPSLQNLDFAWDKDKGIIDTHGTIFPFVFKSKRENPESQLTAYQHLVRYKEEEIRRQNNIFQAKEVLIERQKQTIINRENTIKGKEYLIEKNEKLLQPLYLKIEDLTKISFIAKPIQKISAYKSLTKTYFKLRRSENEKK